jgi:hypothetical protein
MIRYAWLALLPILSACAPVSVDKPERSFAGTVQKVFRITRQGQDVPGITLLGRVGRALAPKLRHSTETLQYVVRTHTGQITAQTDDEFMVGDCVEVIPQGDISGPAFRYGDARVVKSQNCTT